MMLECNFCGKGQDEVRRLYAGKDACICNECITRYKGDLESPAQNLAETISDTMNILAMLHNLVREHSSSTTELEDASLKLVETTAALESLVARPEVAKVQMSGVALRDIDASLLRRIAKLASSPLDERARREILTFVEGALVSMGVPRDQLPALLSGRGGAR